MSMMLFTSRANCSLVSKSTCWKFEASIPAAASCFGSLDTCIQRHITMENLASDRLRLKANVVSWTTSCGRSGALMIKINVFAVSITLSTSDRHSLASVTGLGRSWSATKVEIPRFSRASLRCLAKSNPVVSSWETNTS